MTKIEWTRSDDGSPGKTWNPTVGCSRGSEGCGIGGGGCYAIGVAHRALVAVPVTVVGVGTIIPAVTSHRLYDRRRHGR